MELTKAQQSNLKQAKTMLENILKESDGTYNPAVIDAPYVAVDYCKARVSWRNREVMSVLFLNQQNHLIKAEDMFFGTINETSVYPREIIREALLCNAAAILISHNHPSGNCTPSEADIRLTNNMKKCCKLFDIRMQDHIIVSKKDYYSFAEQEDLKSSQPSLIQ